jgi:hypothetical protein
MWLLFFSWQAKFTFWAAHQKLSLTKTKTKKQEAIDADILILFLFLFLFSTGIPLSPSIMRQ